MYAAFPSVAKVVNGSDAKIHTTNKIDTNPLILLVIAFTVIPPQLSLK